MLNNLNIHTEACRVATYTYRHSVHGNKNIITQCSNSNYYLLVLLRIRV